MQESANISLHGHFNIQWIYCGCWDISCKSKQILFFFCNWISNLFSFVLQNLYLYLKDRSKCKVGQSMFAWLWNKYRIRCCIKYRKSIYLIFAVFLHLSFSKIIFFYRTRIDFFTKKLGKKIISLPKVQFRSWKIQCAYWIWVP